MTLEFIVTSLELSKKLKEIGLPQESLFYWTLGGPVYRSEMPFWTENNYSAFTAQELINFLPIGIFTEVGIKNFADKVAGVIIGLYEIGEIEEEKDETIKRFKKRAIEIWNRRT